MRRLALALLLVACGETSQPGPGEIGTVAPAFGAVALNGDSVNLAKLKGDVVLLNVWATWCIPCRREIPELQALHQEHSERGLHVVGVSVDDSSADADVEEFAKSFSMTYTILRDPGESVSNAFRIPGVPASFLIDREGIVRWRHLGPFKATDSTFLAALNAVL